MRSFLATSYSQRSVPDEAAFSVHNFVAVHFQWGRGGLVLVVLAVAGGTGNGAIGFAFPGA